MKRGTPKRMRMASISNRICRRASAVPGSPFDVCRKLCRIFLAAGPKFGTYCNFVTSPPTGLALPLVSTYVPVNDFTKCTAPASMSSPVNCRKRCCFSSYTGASKLTPGLAKLIADRKNRFHESKPNTQSRFTCASHRRAMQRIHVASSMRGAVAGRRYRVCSLHTGGSGIPPPKGNTYAKAKLKYHGRNWSNTRLPVWRMTVSRLEDDLVPHDPPTPAPHEMQNRGMPPATRM